MSKTCIEAVLDLNIWGYEVSVEHILNSVFIYFSIEINDFVCNTKICISRNLPTRHFIWIIAYTVIMLAWPLTKSNKSKNLK